MDRHQVAVTIQRLRECMAECREAEAHFRESGNRAFEDRACAMRYEALRQARARYGTAPRRVQREA